LGEPFEKAPGREMGGRFIAAVGEEDDLDFLHLVGHVHGIGEQWSRKVA
jgi:hypothetical protein